MNEKLKKYTTRELEEELKRRNSKLCGFTNKELKEEIYQRLNIPKCKKISIFDVAAYFLKLEPSISKKKLNFLCYYAYAWYYTLYNQKLFPEKFEAWIHGPICPELWHNYDEFLELLKYKHF